MSSKLTGLVRMEHWTHSNLKSNSREKRSQIAVVRRRKEVNNTLGPSSIAESATVLAFESLFTRPIQGVRVLHYYPWSSKRSKGTINNWKIESFFHLSQKFQVQKRSFHFWHLSCLFSVHNLVLLPFRCNYSESDIKLSQHITIKNN